MYWMKPECAIFYSDLHGKRQGANLRYYASFSNPSYLFLSFSSLIAWYTENQHYWVVFGTLFISSCTVLLDWIAYNHCSFTSLLRATGITTAQFLLFDWVAIIPTWEVSRLALSKVSDVKYMDFHFHAIVMVLLVL